MVSRKFVLTGLTDARFLEGDRVRSSEVPALLGEALLLLPMDGLHTLSAAILSAAGVYIELRKLGEGLRVVAPWALCDMRPANCVPSFPPTSPKLLLTI